MTAPVYYVQINILLIGIEARGFTIIRCQSTSI